MNTSTQLFSWFRGLITHTFFDSAQYPIPSIPTMTTPRFDPDTRHVFDDIARMFEISDAQLQEITKHFVNEMSLGLAEYSRPVGMM
jgi:hypothetical protein